MFEFRLIDFGILTKFKYEKIPRKYPGFLGTLMFAAQRTLAHE